MSNILRVTPFMHVPDLDQALHFFVAVLGFTLSARDAGYACVEREAAAFRLFEDHPFTPDSTRRFAYYIDVEDLQALITEWQPRLDTLPDREFHGPTDQPYGRRELRLVAPDGNLMAFGQAIHPERAPVTK